MLDTDSIVALAVLAVAGVLLALTSAAEAGVAAITRRRTGARAENGVADLLDGYIRQRQQILRALSAGATLATVALSLAVALLVLGGRGLDWPGAALAGLIALAAAAGLRQNARTLALANPEGAGYRLARVIAVLQPLLAPFGWLVSAPARALLALAGRRPEPSGDPAGELLAVLEAPADSPAGAVLSEERRMMRGVLAMSKQTVREIMSPRTDVVAVSTDASIGDVMKVVTDSGFTRIPLYEETIDRIVGVLYAKDLLAYIQSGIPSPGLRKIARPPYFVPETKHTDELLADLRRDQTHVAVVVDEYGGTAGLVTVEDVLEEIVGEIADEYDVEEVEVERISGGEAIVDARLAIDDLNELFEVEVENEDFDTVGGFVVSLLGRLAAPGDRVESAEHGLELHVLSVHGRRVRRVRVTHAPPASEANDAV